MYKNYILVGISLILLLMIWYSPQLLSNKSLTIYSQQPENNPSIVSNQIQNITWKTYSNSKFGFSIEYPLSWVIKEKTNRFEPGLDLEIKFSGDPSNSSYGKFTFNGGKPTLIDDIATVTELGKKQSLDNNFYVNYEPHLVEDVNISKYVIDGEKSGSFTYSTSTIGSDYASLGSEIVDTIHNGDLYIFQYIANANHFDDIQNTAIRTHMFNSIKWLR
jgi:hypothetical protein